MEEAGELLSLIISRRAKASDLKFKSSGRARRRRHHQQLDLDPLYKLDALSPLARKMLLSRGHLVNGSMHIHTLCPVYFSRLNAADGGVSTPLG
jgi:hypothetical protein